jgi:hypothetical protein
VEHPVKKTKKIIIVSEEGQLYDHEGKALKRCTKCKQLKPLEDFGFRQMKPENPDLLYVQPQCKTCR